MNSSTFSCGVSGASAPHSVGNVMPVLAAEFATWKSLNSTRPHCMASGVPIGVLNV
jgi:hypothetical protein